MGKLLCFLGLFSLFFAQFVLFQLVESRVQYKNWTRKRQPSKDRFLYFVREPAASFVDAQTLCAVDQFVLAEFKDDADVEFLNEALNTEFMPGVAEVDYIYLGGVYVGPEVDGSGSKFKWFESGTDVTNWGPGQPNKFLNGVNENCVVAYRAGEGAWAVGDGTCVQKFPFICATTVGH